MSKVFDFSLCSVWAACVAFVHYSICAVFADLVDSLVIPCGSTVLLLNSVHSVVLGCVALLDLFLFLSACLGRDCSALLILVSWGLVVACLCRGDRTVVLSLEFVSKVC